MDTIEISTIEEYLKLIKKSKEENIRKETLKILFSGARQLIRP